MSLLWLTLVLLHQGYSLVPVVTVQLGDSVTFMCSFTETFQTVRWLHWYKQTTGENLKLITMIRKSTNPTFGPGISALRFNITYSPNISNLTILSTSKEDEGTYHCAHLGWIEATWTGTYLSVKGKSERTSRYTVVQQTSVSDPSHPTDSKVLQCSVLSDPENKDCSGDPRVFWFRARSENSHPDVIYTDGKRPANCDLTRDSERRCSYNFFKNISSSDDGTYLCAIATCGQILFGNKTNLKMDETPSSETLLLIVTIICLTISVTVNIVFICYRIQRSACKQLKEGSSSQTTHNGLNQMEEDVIGGGQDLNYAALNFSGGKAPRGTKKRELRTEESVYSQVKGSM
ncbi:uncharacterized protein LOC108231237 [Kryptolebias marmoratus]|uniref:uncharacterized protein LOC108231237 n=1 Tax=Kryptolebias marmoratus TaxID=37003 RepID=UPI0018ACEEF7|nr:uncharacterized protein LOC108231237 [Kryptolebias marmoratus]